MAASFTSCCKKRVYCNSGDVDFAFVGYERVEARTFVLRRYAAGGEEPLDSARYVYNGNRPDTFKVDTLYFSEFTTTDMQMVITAGNDWEVYMPYADKTLKFFEITEADHRFDLVRCDDNKTSCIKPVTGFLLNGQWVNNDMVYLTNGVY